MHPRVVALLLVASCAPPEPAPQPPPVHWVYPPATTSAALGELKGRFGRSQAPQRALSSGITGEPTVPLRLATPWRVPGDGPARAVVYGLEGARSAVELIDIDRGQVMWRDTKLCAGLVVGVTAAAIVCTDAAGTRGLGLDGKLRWHNDSTFIAITDDRVVLAAVGEAVVIGADDGEELGRVKLPEATPIETVIASCGDAGREVFAVGRSGALARIADTRGGPALSWWVPLSGVSDLDPCTGTSILVTGGNSLTAIDRATGKITGRLEEVFGHWPARDGSDRIEIATATGVASWSRDLVGPPNTLPLPALGQLIDKRGDRRLVRASNHTAVVLDRAGVRAYLPFAARGGVLGEDSILSASWTESPGESVHRIGLPARTRRVLRVPEDRVGVALPAELRDLPPPLPIDLSKAIAKPDTGKHAVDAIALDPYESATLYAVALESVPDESRSATLAAADLAKREWRWQRADGCGPGLPVALAVAREVVVCAAQGVTSIARATSRDGAARWEYETDNIDRVTASGGVVLAFDADRLEVLDAATGRVRGRFASDDGAAMRAAVLEVGAQGSPETWLVTAEQGRLVARIPSAGMVAVWSLHVDGVVRELLASGEGVLVVLEDGDAFRVELATAKVIGVPGLGLDWRATGDLVTGETVGGPIPAPPLLAPPRPKVPFDVRGRPVAPRETEAPPLWNPVPMPRPLGDSWQLTLYELTGGLRARNDYPLERPIFGATTRGPKGSPLVIAYGSRDTHLLVLDPRTGDPMRRVQLPADAPPPYTFGTIVDGSPVAGVVLALPLRVVLF